jgi:hypothetical protein
MLARLIAELADVNLQRIDHYCPQLDAVCRQLLIEHNISAGRRG